MTKRPSASSLISTLMGFLRTPYLDPMPRLQIADEQAHAPVRQRVASSLLDVGRHSRRRHQRLRDLIEKLTGIHFLAQRHGEEFDHGREIKL
jgi:hypothetical protein